MTYRILAHYYYYNNTLNAPKDGYFRAWDRVRFLEFDSHESALGWLEKNYGGMKLCRGKATYTNKGDYWRRHNEYSTPEYTIVHFKDKKELN